ncbi:glycosyltransferase family 4 protein [Vibrio hibernica]|uniref:glycosyltransferase family 4 protein n=1 Tax=Vibrio hibernica TaxID=2587465 RepID=UPI001882F172|nr:glycosyltransferase family 4 protein [Vibrio hibernica]
MKILIVNTSDIDGGAARAAYRLHQSLLSKKIDSQMLVQNKLSDDASVIGPRNRLEKVKGILKSFFDSIPVKFYKRKIPTLFSVSWVSSKSIVNQINIIQPDIVHLHWVNSGMLRIEDFAKINAPIVWSLHDDWAFTGGCHIKWDCGKYINGCSNCPILLSNCVNDLSASVFKRKDKTFNKIKNMNIVGLSNWLTECSKNSALLSKKLHVNLPNPINTKTYKPINRGYAREQWGFPKEKKLILFGAMNPTSDINKGFYELELALTFLNKINTEIVIFGASKPTNNPDFGCKTHYLGALSDDIALSSLYNAVDVMVVPSRQENLSNAIMESLSCGTPVVAFDVGGNSDLILHKENGYLAKPLDGNDMANGIEWVLNNVQYNELRLNARKKVLSDFDSELVSAKYIDLYNSIIRRN